MVVKSWQTSTRPLESYKTKRGEPFLSVWLQPHYPLQLAKQIGISQQAVMKHLRLLENVGFVVKMKAASNKGGPPKNIYSVQQAISIRIDLGPDLFQCNQRILPAGGPLKLSNKLQGDMVSIAEVVSGRKMIGVGEGAHPLSAISEEIERLDRERDALSPYINKSNNGYRPL